MVHELKTWPVYFQAVLNGTKTFEVRKDDRGFWVGDTLILKEYNPDTQQYTGRKITKEVGFILNSDFPGIAEDYVAMSLLEVKKWSLSSLDS